MQAFMYHETIMVTVQFTTHITAISMLSVMHLPVTSEISLVPECFITHITAIRMLSAMYDFMSLKRTLMSE